jgi:prevent-host-death family protein
MKSLSARDAKYGFGRMIDLARAAPVLIEKHGRPVVVVMAIEEFERLKGLERRSHGASARFRKTATANSKV